MKVKDMIRSLMDKDPDDDVVIKVKARIYTNNNKGGTVECEAIVDDVMPGNTPVLLSADITVNIESKVEMY